MTEDEKIQEYECGYCQDTGEVACSSSSYMACPECKARREKAASMTPIPPSQIPKDLTEAYERAVDSMAIQLERDALLSYTNLCEDHKQDCATGHRPFATCASCLLTTATRMRFKAENERDALQQKIATDHPATPIPPIPEDLKRWSPAARLEGDKPHGYMVGDKEGLWYFASTVDQRIAKLTAANEELERENTRLKALIETSTWVCGKCGHGSTEHGLVGHPAANCIYEPVLITHNAASRATRTSPQEGQ